MIRIKTLAKTLALLCAICFFHPLNAQTVSENSEETGEAEGETINAIDRIIESSYGNIEIIISDDLEEKILTPPTAHKRNTGNQHQSLRPGINRMNGYRIQVFSDGRNQASLEARAKARGNAIAARFPKYRGQVYVFSSSPNWYARIGNFKTQAEATSAMNELKRNFPAFANEMRVVKSKIVVIR